MSTLVTGGAGYIGSHMVWHLVDQGEDVVVIDDLSTGFEWAVAPQAKFVSGDCGDEKQIRQLIADHDIDAIIHFAGSIIVPESVADPLGYYLNNTLKSRSLIATAVAGGVSNFIFSSTAAVYGTPSSYPVTEETPLGPESPYGRSKLMTEMMLADAADAHDLRFAALRYFNVAGADPKGRAGQSTRSATHLIKVACEAAIGKRDCVTVYGDDYGTPDGTGIRDYIHVSDLVSIHAEALNALQAGRNSFTANCGYGHGYSVLEVLDAVRRVSGCSIPVAVGPRRQGDPAAIVGSPRLIEETLGWRPRFDDLDEIVETALRWECAMNPGIGPAALGLDKAVALAPA